MRLEQRTVESHNSESNSGFSEAKPEAHAAAHSAADPEPAGLANCRNPPWQFVIRVNKSKAFCSSSDDVRR